MGLRKPTTLERAPLSQDNRSHGFSDGCALGQDRNHAAIHRLPSLVPAIIEHTRRLPDIVQAGQSQKLIRRVGIANRDRKKCQFKIQSVAEYRNPPAAGSCNCAIAWSGDMDRTSIRTTDDSCPQA